MGKKAEEPIGVDGFSHSLLFYNIKRDIQITYGYLKGFSELSNDFFTIRKKIDVDLSPKDHPLFFFVILYTMRIYRITLNIYRNIICIYKKAPINRIYKLYYNHFLRVFFVYTKCNMNTEMFREGLS